MIDRVFLEANESYEFLTDNQYVVVVSLGNIEVYKDDKKLAVLNFLENFSCPSGSGSYVVKALENGANVLLVRYILI